MAFPIIDLEKIDFAFQAIVNTHSGKIFAVEALIRNTDKIGFNSIQDFFDTLYKKKELFKIDLILREKAFKKFRDIEIKNLKIFYNIDNRIFSMPDFNVNATPKILNKLNLKKDLLCFELTEHYAYEDENTLKEVIKLYKENGFCIAIDDFGTGVSGLHLLYESDANIIKIDKFFIKDINLDSKKKLFCASIVDMAHIMGMRVIAEGVETISEYYACKELKIDFIQGYLIAKPSLDVEKIKKSYTNKCPVFNKERRVVNKNLIDKSYIEKIEPLNINASLLDLFIYFKEHTRNTFVPIINDNKKILGAIYEVDIKEMSYSQYGLSLAKNSSSKEKLKSYIKPVLEIDLSWGVDKALEIFSMRNDAKGIFVTKDTRYYGFINLSNLLSLSYKRNIEIAQNQNPLTKLPGNDQIDDFIKTIFEEKKRAHIVYFDFNDFKPFNDKYGFRQGDRAILMFSEILRKNLNLGTFIAHIGGDDFFLGFIDEEYEKIYSLIYKIQKDFEINASSLYSQEDIKNNHMTAKDRYGTTREFRLLSVSAAIVGINKKSTLENFNTILGNIKKASKSNTPPLGVCIYL